MTAFDAPSHITGPPLSVLQVHNLYRSNVPSGENDSVMLLSRAWTAAGATVTRFCPSSDELVKSPTISMLKTGATTLGRPNEELRKTLREQKPDVLVAHNLHPQVSPSDLRYAQSMGVPVIHVVHNYRHSCLAATHFRKGQACTSCSLRRFATPGVLRKCYRQSVPQSMVLATSNTMYGGLWRELDAYIAISPHIADYLVTEGFPPERIHVIPNPVEAVESRAVAGTGVLYAGRLEREKGVELLLDAWRMLPTELRQRRALHVAGQGGLRPLVLERSRSDPSIRFHGLLGASKLKEIADDCAVTVIPSLWDEPFGRAAAESLMRGHAIVVTNRGALADIASAGAAWVVEPQAQAMSEALVEALHTDNTVRAERGRDLATLRYGVINVGKEYVHVFRSVPCRRRRT